MNRTALRGFLALSALLAGAALAQTPPPAERDAGYHNRQNLYLYTLSPAEGWRATASGLRYRKVSGSADGPRPGPTDRVTVHYVGRFIDGAEFDSSVARNEPATFPLIRVIRGWTEGVQLMNVGDRFEFAIPYQLAYGPAGRGPIPGGATLLFTVDLIAIAPSGR